jgi:hypothetical protein
MLSRKGPDGRDGNRKMPRRTLTAEQAGWIRWLSANTSLFQHQIAAAVETNQGRVSEVLRGDRFPGVPSTRPPQGVLELVNLIRNRNLRSRR